MSLPPSELVPFLGTQNLIVYNTVAASAFTIWNHWTTFHEEEVELIWRSKWGLVNMLYCVIRYVTLLVRIVEMLVYTDVYGIVRPSPKTCMAWVWFEMAAGLTVYIAVELLLVLRIFAFYGRNMRFLVILITLFIFERVSTLVIAVIAVPKFEVQPSTFPPNIHVGRCIVTRTTGLFLSFWVPGLTMESLLFLLLIAKYFETKIYTGMSSPRLLGVFVRDGAWAFALMFPVLLWASLGFELGGRQGDVALTWIYSVLDFCGTRLILNLRAVARNQVSTTNNVLELNVLHTEFTLSGNGFARRNNNTTIDESPRWGRESSTMSEA